MQFNWSDSKSMWRYLLVLATLILGSVSHGENLEECDIILELEQVVPEDFMEKMKVDDAIRAVMEAKYAKEDIYNIKILNSVFLNLNSDGSQAYHVDVSSQGIHRTFLVSLYFGPDSSPEAKWVQELREPLPN